MSGDCMGSKERAWLCAGCGSFRDKVASRPRLMWADDERPILVLPASYDDEMAEIAFGWALSEMGERRLGWLGLLRRAMLLCDRDAEVA
jgi:hypothetical protein